MRRFGAILVVIAAALVAAVPLASTAGATAAPASCAALSGTLTGTATLSKCTDPANTGGSGKLVINVKTLVGTVTWNKTGTTTIKLTYTVPKVNKCAKPTIEVVLGGSVTGGKGAALKSIPAKSKISATACYGTKTATLLPKTVFRF